MMLGESRSSPRFPAPVGVIAFDLDLDSSTAAALTIVTYLALAESLFTSMTSTTNETTASPATALANRRIQG
jgi:hypothetical protein